MSILFVFGPLFAVLGIIFLTKSVFNKVLGIKVEGGSNVMLGDGGNKEKAEKLKKEPLQNPDVTNGPNGGNLNMPINPAGERIPEFGSFGASSSGMGVGGVSATGIVGVVNAVGIGPQTGNNVVSNTFAGVKQKISGPIIQGGQMVYNRKLNKVQDLQQNASSILNTTKGGRLTMNQGPQARNIISGAKVGIQSLSDANSYIYGGVRKIQSGAGNIHTKMLQIKGISKAQNLLVKKFVSHKGMKSKMYRLASGYENSQTLPSGEEEANKQIATNGNVTLNVGAKALSGNNRNAAPFVRVDGGNVNVNMNPLGGAMYIPPLVETRGNVPWNVNTPQQGNPNLSATSGEYGNIPGNTLPNQNGFHQNMLFNTIVTQSNGRTIRGVTLPQDLPKKQYTAENPKQQLAMLVAKEVFGDKEYSNLSHRQLQEMVSIVLEQKAESASMPAIDVAEGDARYRKDLNKEVMELAPDLPKELKLQVINGAMEKKNARRREQQLANQALAMAKTDHKIQEESEEAIDTILKRPEVAVFYNRYRDENFENISTLSKEQIEQIEEKARNFAEKREDISLEEKEKEYEKYKASLTSEETESKKKEVDEIIKLEILSNPEDAKDILGEEGARLLQQELEEIKQNRQELYQKFLQTQKKDKIRPFSEYKKSRDEQMRRDINQSMNEIVVAQRDSIYIPRQAQENEIARKEIG